MLCSKQKDLQLLSLSVEEALFRVVQEALSNIARHSQATLVQIVVETADNIVTLSVLDNGQGFDMTPQTRLGIGLFSMQERMRALGGDVRVESTRGKGTCVIAHCTCLGIETHENSKISQLRIAAELAPDVILMDLVMPGIGGVEATRQIKQVSPHSQIIILTSYHEDEYIFPALRAGALSYVLTAYHQRENSQRARQQHSQ